MNRRIGRTITLGTCALVFQALGASRQARATDTTTPYPGMPPLDQYLMDRNAEIALARSGALFAFPQDQPALPTEKVAVVFSQNIHYFEAGQGSAVILLHGLGGGKEARMASFGALAAQSRVYAIDQIGFGHSDKPLLDYKIATFADFLQGFMQAQNIPKATLVGNSLGGWIALDFSVHHPGMVEKLVLVDSAGPPWTHAFPADLNPSSVVGMRAMLESVFYDKEILTDDVVLQAFTNHVRSSEAYTIQRAMAGWAVPQFEDARLASIHAPTLVVWSRQDVLISPVSGEKLRDGIPGTTLVLIEECGHAPEIEKPVEFNRALLEFLGR